MEIALHLPHIVPYQSPASEIRLRASVLKRIKNVPIPTAVRLPETGLFSCFSFCLRVFPIYCNV